jgi:hypothetical protein
VKTVRIHLTSLGVEDVVGDIVQTFRIALERLGHEVTYQHSVVAPGMLNIVFFCWGLRWEDLAALQPDCIVVNFEHLTPGGQFFPEPYRDILQRAYVWEYSESNFQRMPQLGMLRADYTPLGYEDGAAPVLALDALLPEAQRDIDVLFFGLQSARRVKVLDDLRALGLRVETTSQRHWSPEERDAYLLRSKVVLNIHNYDDSRIVEIPRLSIFFRHRKAIVCELYPDSEIDPSLRDAMVGAGYDGLVAATAALVADPARRAALEGLGLSLFSTRSQSGVLAPALERFLEWRDHTRCIDALPHRPLAAKARISVIVALDGGALPTGLSPDLLAAYEHLELDLIPVGSCADSESRCAAFNAALRDARGDFVVFVHGAEALDPGRLAAQAAYLADRLEVAVVGYAETWQALLDHEIKAGMLASTPVSTHGRMFRRQFLLGRGIAFDPAFAGGADAHFVFQCVAAGARFSGVPVDAGASGAVKPAPGQASPPSPDAAESMQAGRWMLARVFPDLSTDELDLLVLLYAPLWEPTAAFAKRLLGVMGKAARQDAMGLHFSPAEVRRVLRNEALRLLRIYRDAGLIDAQWLLHCQSDDATVASFLAPLRDAVAFLDQP